jgi:hypothetical protein
MARGETVGKQRPALPGKKDEKSKKRGLTKFSIYGKVVIRG